MSHSPLPSLHASLPPRRRRGAARARARAGRSSRAVVVARRLALAVLVLATVALASGATARLLAANGLSPIEALLQAIFAVLFTTLALSFWTSALGAWVLLRRGARPLELDEQEADDAPPLSRTAIVMPVHNEDPARVMAGIAATLASLARTRHAAAFDVFVLSDTTDPAVWIEEELAFDRLRRRVGQPERLHYRKRRSNTERKAGNIADFCAEHGERYRFMVVFDADSVMSGRALVALVRAMERDERAGIIQAPPLPVNRLTLFGRLQQFGSRVYGPVFHAGLAAWQDGEGNYWGHNAILRIRPFVEHCKLPRLPGREPLGGSILSHDFVEAALMRRAGWKVYLAPGLEGSYEESPPTLVDHAARDRRWCQGNLQHARLLGMPGLNLVSRAHLALGVMAYVGSLLWMATLVLTTVEALRQHNAAHSYFRPDSLFPVWQVSIANQAALLYAVVAAMLLLPKLWGLLFVLADRRARGRFGGGVRLARSAAFEMLFSVLLAPVLAWLQARFVVTILLGRSVGWGSQERGDVSTTWGQAVARHGGATLLGLLWAAMVQRLVPDLLPWLAPVLAGLVFSIPLSVLSSRVSVGLRARRAGLLAVPEEKDPPFVLRRLREELAVAAAAGGDGDAPPRAPAGVLERVLGDPHVRAVHLALLPPEPGLDPLERHALDGLVLKARLRGCEALTPAEIRAVLLDRRALEALACGA